MFVRTESFKEFIRFYPIVSFLVGLHFALWLLMDFLQLGFAVDLKEWGTGMNVLILNGEYWRLITPIFLHGDFTHALFNSFSLVLFGPALEQMLGKVKFVILYITAGFIGNLGTFLVNPDGYYWHLGASGAIFGIFGVYLYMVMNRKHLIDAANSQIILAIFAIGLFMTFVQPNINITAHLFGLIGGFALAPVILKNAQRFSLWQVRARHSRSDNDDISFNPNRWKKRKYGGKSPGKYILWGIIIFLALFALINRI